MHTFCRGYLVNTMEEVKKHATKEEMKAAWVWKSGKHVEFHGPNGYYWHGQGCCLWAARADGWHAWMQNFLGIND